jgi:hypothetical protein
MKQQPPESTTYQDYKRAAFLPGSQSINGKNHATT